MPEQVQSDGSGGAHLPLSGIVVLDLTLARAGPTCVRHLADWGADVIRIEPPQPSGTDVTGARDGFDFQNLHRNKRMMQLDLKSAEGHAAFLRLVERADVVVENMRVAVKDRLRINYDDLRKINPRIIYGSISGFGQTGPYALRAGVDQVAQGMSGLMSITGLPGQGPVRAGIPVSDLTAGNLLAFGITMALFDRTRTGEGRWVTTSLLEAQVFMLDFQATRWLMKKEVAPQAGNDHPTSIPQGVFPASDGYFNIAAASQRIWERFCEAIGCKEWTDKAEWKTMPLRSANRHDINAAIAEVTKQKPMAHWVELLEEAGVPSGPINTIDKVFEDPQVQHLQMATPAHHPRLGDIDLVNNPLNLSGFEKGVRHATADFGAHTEEILTSLGYSSQDIAEFRMKKVI
jgi:formyl-CoA transferase